MFFPDPAALLPLIVLIPFLGAILSPLAYRGRASIAVLVPLLSAALPLAILGLLLSNLGGAPVMKSWEWVEGLPLSFSLQLDGFGGLFAFLVAFIGVLIVWYAHLYMEDDPGRGRFFGFLLLFLAAMLGIAISDHFFVTYFFWELTSISSFFLIGYWHEKEKSRDGALKALFITSIGGLFLMAGMALLGARTGVWTWSALGTIDPAIATEPWFTAAFLLILVGVFTKSAQFPFHIWLPDAMEAPTPVSAFLHSATMVKAGVFLLFRLQPLFAHSSLWTPLLITVGMTTVLVGSVLALKRTDLKAILAYSTVSQLGLFVALHGYSGIDAVFGSIVRTAFIFHIVVHACYKGSLFMLTGIVDHAAHTRDIRVLGGLGKRMPRTMAFFALSAASMAGLPPFLGFISKELGLDLFLDASSFALSWGWAPLMALLLSASASVAIALKLSVGLAFSPPENASDTRSSHAHDAPWPILIPPAILGSAGLLFGLFPDLLKSLLYPVGLVGLMNAEEPSLSLWHGINAPLLLSLTAVTAGFVLFHYRGAVRRWQESIRPLFTFDGAYSLFWEATLGWAKRTTGILQNGNLSWYSALFLGFISVITVSALVHRQSSVILGELQKTVLPFETLVMAGLVLTSLLVVFLRERLTRIVTIGVAGILMCALFALRGAPDLALTGFLVEIVMFIVVLVVLKQLPQEEVPVESRTSSAGKALVAGLAGTIFGFLVYMVLQSPLAASIYPYFVGTSEKLAGGLNVVNVILVDYRGFDTFGEILVLCLAGLGVYGLRSVWAGRRPHEEPSRELRMKSLPPSQILTAISAVAFPLILVLALYLTLRGHNNPGGGFIGGLTFAGGLILEMLAVGRQRFLAMFRVKGHVLYSAGLALALGTGLVPMFFGLPFLTSAVFHSIHFSTATFFDLGVFLVVVGVTLDLVTLLEEGEREKADA